MSYGSSELLPAVGFDFELFAARAGELVIPGAAIVIGGSPTGLDPSAALEAVKGRVQGALLDAEDVTRYLLHAFGDGPAVLRTNGERSEDEEVECALREVDVRWQQFIPLVLLQEVIRHLL